MNKGFTYLQSFKPAHFALLFSYFRHRLPSRRKCLQDYDLISSLCLITHYELILRNRINKYMYFPKSLDSVLNKQRQ